MGPRGRQGRRRIGRDRALTHTIRRRDVTTRRPAASVFFGGLFCHPGERCRTWTRRLSWSLSQGPSDVGRCVIRQSNGCALSMQRRNCRGRSGTRLPTRVRGHDWSFRHRQDSLRSGRGSDDLRRECQKICARAVLSDIDEPFAEDDGELCSGLEPFPRRTFPRLGRMIENEI